MIEAELPSAEYWAELYAKSRARLVNSLGNRYSLADREDAVEHAFDKLMHRKSAEAYGEKFPQSESDWLRHLYWQAKSYLAHLKSHVGVHAKYVESMSKELEGVFAADSLDFFLDSETRSAALSKALELFKSEQDVSRRDLGVFILRASHEIPSKEVAARYGISEENVNVIKFRVGKLLRKHGPDCYDRALHRAA